MRIAVIEQKHRQYIKDTFSRHPKFEGEIVCFAEYEPEEKEYQSIPIISLSELKKSSCDAVLIAVNHNHRLSHLLTYLHDEGIEHIYIIRLFTLNKQADFIVDSGFDMACVDEITKDDVKPYLVHLETHVCDHCNLNCKACNNFAPFVKERRVADTVQFEKDIKKLASLFSKIGRFFLLGGEPLLEAELCCEMIRIYRKYFPDAELRILTNAILVPKMRKEFWDYIRENNVIIHISLYPPVAEKLSEIETILQSNNIKYLLLKKVVKFEKRLTLFPFEDAKFNNQNCGSAGCHYLRNGIVSKCPDGLLIGNMAQELGCTPEILQDDQIIDINQSLDAWDIIRRLNGSCGLCRRCTQRRNERIDWEVIGKGADPHDWLLSECEEDIWKAAIRIYEQEGKIKELSHMAHKLEQNAVITLAEVEEKEKKLREITKHVKELKTHLQSEEEELDSIYAKLSDKELQLDSLNEKYNHITQSLSYKIGRVITCLPRKVLGNGFIQLNRIFKNTVLLGYKTYRNILTTYPSDSGRKIFFMDYVGSGDVYLSCAYLKSRGFIEDKDIFVSPSTLVTKIASYYGFEQIVNINIEKAFAIRIMERFLGTNIRFLPMLYESMPLAYSGILRYMQGHRGLDFMSLLKIGFQINLNLEYEELNCPLPALPYDEKEIDVIFNRYQLVPERTVLIAPYAGHSLRLPLHFYHLLVCKLLELGFKVCTNSVDLQKEPVAEGSIPLRLPHNLLKPFCERAGFFIGFRSGLVDIMSSAKMKCKIIIFPNMKTQEGIANHGHFFSLKEMGLCDDALEIIYDQRKDQSLINEIIDNISLR